jgi:hypothetical protein
MQPAVSDANPVLGIVMGTVFAISGIVVLAAPALIQRLAAKAVADAKRRRVPLPFASFVESTLYIPGLRILGILNLLVSLVLFWTVFIEMWSRR